MKIKADETIYILYKANNHGGFTKHVIYNDTKRDGLLKSTFYYSDDYKHGFAGAWGKSNQDWLLEMSGDTKTMKTTGSKLYEIDANYPENA